MNSIEQRISALERSALRWRLAACGLAAMIGVGGLAGTQLQPPARDPTNEQLLKKLVVDEIRVKRLYVVNRDRAVGAWSADADGDGRLEVWNAATNGCALISYSRSGGLPALTMFDNNRSPRVILAAEATGARLQLLDGAGTEPADTAAEVVAVGAGGLIKLRTRTRERCVMGLEASDESVVVARMPKPPPKEQP